MKDKLVIVVRLKRTYEFVSKIIYNYPHKYLDLRKAIERELLNMIELCYLANFDVDKEANQYRILSKLAMVDYYIKLSYEAQLITKKRFEGISRHLLEIKNMLYGWIENGKES